MNLELRQLHPLFAAEAEGVDLSRPIDAAMVDAIWRAIDEYAVVVFRDQRLDDTQLRDFAAYVRAARNWPCGRDRQKAAAEAPRDRRHLQSRRGRQSARARDRRRLDMLGNRLWHTDASYMPVPVVLGMLHAKAVPPASALGGGETEFADMRAAYDALSPAMQAEIADLVIEHDIFWSRGQIGFTEFGPGEREKYPPSQQRLVRRHPGSAARRCICRRTPRTSSAGRSRRAHPALRPNPLRDPAGIRLQPPMADRRSRHLGQPRHDASRPPARRNPPPRPAPRHDPRYRLDPRRSRVSRRTAPSAWRAVLTPRQQSID